MDIKKPDIDVKALLAKAAFLKNHLNMLVPILIAVVGGVLFIPTHIINAGLQEDIQSESLRQASTLRRLADTAVSERQWQVEREFQQDYAEDANAIARWVRQTSQRSLLAYNLFPDPATSSNLVFEAFGKRYIQTLGEKLAGLGAIEAPKPDDLANVVEGFGAGGRGGEYGMGIYGAGRGGPQTAASAAQQKVVDAVCRDRARSGKVYADLSVLAGTSYWQDEFDFETKDQALEDCWYWQLGYWIIEDVLDAVAACNRQASSVLDAPVKRLRTVQFARPMIAGTMSTMGYGRGMGVYGEGGMAGMGAAEENRSSSIRPKYILTVGDYLSPACTKRVSDETTDVVHFAVQAIVAARAVTDFESELCSVREHVYRGVDGTGPEQRFQHNQITILEVHINGIDRDDPRHTYYRYGDEEVRDVTFVCEYLFNKKGYEPWLPEVVKQVFESDEQEGY